MSRRIYFGKILAEIASQNGQGRFFDSRATPNAEVYEHKRRSVFTITVGRINFDYDLTAGQHEFYTLHGDQREQVPEGWDGFTSGQQMSFASELYDFLYSNRMTNSSFEEFLQYLSASPI